MIKSIYNYFNNNNKTNDNKYSIYILKLEENKYYIGKTTSLIKRILDHFINDGSAWTKKYKPIEVLEVHSNCDSYDEDKYTIKYMDKYGIDNVRGGSYVMIKLDENTIDHINRQLNSNNDLCHRCGHKGHFIKDCHVYLNKLNKQKNCNKCGRSSHTEENCYAKTYIKNIKKKCCNRCGRSNHTEENCFANSNINGEFIYI